MRWIRKCLSQPEVRAVILVFRSVQQAQNTLGKVHWVLDLCHNLSNSVKWFLRTSRKCFSQSEARAFICAFRSTQKHKLGRGRWVLASHQVSSNSIWWFLRSWKYLRQSEARVATLVFWSIPQHYVGRGCWVLPFCQVSLISVQLFLRVSRKREKLTMDWRIDDRQRVRLWVVCTKMSTVLLICQSWLLNLTADTNRANYRTRFVAEFSKYRT